MLSLLGLAFLTPAQAQEQGAVQCADNLDNDSDGGVDRFGRDLNSDGDYLDLGELPYDNDCRIEQRTGVNLCADGIDNDGDGLLNGADPDCGFEYLCEDGISNDLDGLVDGADTDCDCLSEVQGEDLSCVANDIEVVLVGLGTPIDGCVNPSDQITINLRALLGSQGGNTRYDIQVYTGIDQNQAQTGVCSRQVLQPVVAAGTPTDAQMARGAGPYRHEDGAPNNDICGEVTGSDDVLDLPGTNDPDAALDFPFPVTLTCTDAFDSDGFLDIPTCATYEQNSDDGCQNPTGADDIVKPKCRCDEASPSDVPVPDLRCGTVPTGTDTGLIGTLGQMVCVDLGHDGAAIPTPFGTAGDGDLAPGEAARCVVRYRNAPVGVCTPLAPPYATADAERFACGAVGFVRFNIAYDTTRGSIIGTPSTIGFTDSGAADFVDAVSLPGIIRWVPISNSPTDSPGLTGLGVVRRGDAATLTFLYRASLANVGLQNTSFQMSTSWANAQTFASPVTQASITCNAALRTTPVGIGYFRADSNGGSTTIRWTTETESGNLGFNLYGKVGSEWVRLNDEPIPSRAIDSSVTLDYSFDVSGVEASHFRIESLDIQGEAETHGPFRLGRDYGSRPEKSTIDWASVRAGLDQPRPGVVKVAQAAKGGPTALGAVALSVSKTGLHRVTFEALLAAGFDFSKVQSDDLALSVVGAQVPIRVAAGKFFTAGSFFEFWGEGLDTIYTDKNVYRLEVANKTGLRVAIDAAAPGAGAGGPSYAETVKVESNALYSISAPGPDPFIARQIQRFGAPVSSNFTLPIQGLVAGAGQRLHLELWGVTAYETAADHHVKVKLNGTEVADRSFSGRDQLLVDVGVDGLLVEGANTVTVQLLADNGLPTDLIVVESFGATYPRAPIAKSGALRLDSNSAVVEVSGLTSSSGVAYRLGSTGPVYLSGATFAGGVARLPGAAGGASFAVSEVSALHVPAIAAARTPGSLLVGEAEYLVISHGAFLDGLGQLVAARQANGLSVAVVDVADVYAAYSGGVVDAQAIRSFISDAARLRNTQYVLLVGGDTYDYRNYIGSSVSFVPSLYAATSPLIQHAPADPQYADIDGDGVQDLAIGRFPVRTLSELSYIVDKTLQYDGKDYAGTTVLAADKFDTVGNLSFKVQGDFFLSALAGSWDATKAYLDDEPTVAATKAKIVGAVNAGTALTGFFGHSAPSVWTFSNLLRTSDVAALTNGGRPTVVVQWGCWNAYYVEPAFNTLGHAWTVFGTQGAAAALGSTTLVDDASAQELSTELAPLLAQPGVPIGMAVAEAKYRLAQRRGGLVDVQLGWSLLGDPALVISP